MSARESRGGDFNFCTWPEIETVRRDTEYHRARWCHAVRILSSIIDVRKDEFLRAALDTLRRLAPHEELRVALGAPRLAKLALDDLAHEQVAEEHDVQVRRLGGHDEREWPMYAILHRKELVALAPGEEGGREGGR